jgi:hypothetical protein
MLDDLNQTPVDQLASLLLNEGNPEFLPEDVKQTFCTINSVYLDSVKPEDNFFHQIISKYFSQLCIQKNIYIKSADRFEIKNLKRANVYLVKYVCDGNEFKTYFINKSGDKLFSGGGEFYEVLTRLYFNKGCIYCDFNSEGCEECENEAIKNIIKQIPQDYVDGSSSNYNALCAFFGKKEIDVITDFIQYYFNYINKLKQEVSEDGTVNKKLEKDKYKTSNKLLDSWLSKVEKLDAKVLLKLKQFVTELLAEYKMNDDIKHEFKGCKDIDRTLVYVIQFLIKLSAATKRLKAGEAVDEVAMMENFLVKFFES